MCVHGEGSASRWPGGWVSPACGPIMMEPGLRELCLGCASTPLIPVVPVLSGELLS